jgi:hypothetical protein
MIAKKSLNSDFSAKLKLSETYTNQYSTLLKATSVSSSSLYSTVPFPQHQNEANFQLSSDNFSLKTFILYPDLLFPLFFWKTSKAKATNSKNQFQRCRRKRVILN